MLEYQIEHVVQYGQNRFLVEATKQARRFEKRFGEGSSTSFYLVRDGQWRTFPYFFFGKVDAEKQAKLNKSLDDHLEKQKTN